MGADLGLREAKAGLKAGLTMFEQASAKGPGSGGQAGITT